MPDSMITLVTGANKGIGREIASQLADLGHTVIIGARSADAGEKAAAELREAGGNVTSVVLDVTNPESAAAAADTVRQRYGRLDALIKCGYQRPPRRGLCRTAAGHSERRRRPLRL